MQRLQLRMLESGSRYLKIKGKLVYSTCSLEREENESVVEEFLHKHPSFRREAPRKPALLQHCTGSGNLRLFPSEFSNDGFFAAILCRFQE